MSHLIGGVVALLIAMINNSYGVTIGSCNIQSGASSAVATASFGGSPRSTSGCLVNQNCNYEVHVIGNYESNGHTGFRIQNTGFTSLTITGSSSRRLILVLSSYELVEWVLHIPAGVVIEKVIISAYSDNSIVAPPGQVLAVENSLRYLAYSGTSSGTRSLLNNIQGRFGPISSFTTTYAADGWSLRIGSQTPSCSPSSAPPTVTPNIQPVSPSLRLVGGTTCQGRLELRAAISSQLAFGQACDSDFGNDEAMVVCRELGCSATGAQKVTANQFGFSSSVDVYRGFRYTCSGSENALSACQPSASVCTPDNANFAIAISCGGTTPMPTTTVAPTPALPGNCPEDERCLFGDYCSGQYSTGAACVNGFCQCLNNPRRDRCTCLSTIGSCHIRKGATNAVASATFRGVPQTTLYSCVANDNCDYEVHIIGNYESNGHTGFRVHNDGFTNLYLTITGSSSRRLVLVLASYEHVQWTLHIPSGVVIDRVIISSFLNSSIVAPPGQVLAVENTLQHSSYGPDDGGGDTEELLMNIYNRFGPISSYTGTYRADGWRLTINRGNPDSGCVTAPPTSATSSVSTGVSTSAPNPMLALSLVGGDSCHGRLQMGSSQACSLNTDDSEARVICRELGCNAAGAQRVNAYLYGFSASVNSYRSFGYACDGSENSLRDCRTTGSICAADSVDHAIAISCGSNGATEMPTPFILPNFMSNLGGSSSLLSATEAECIQKNRGALSENSVTASCLASSSPIDVVCRVSDCYQAIDLVYTRCGRPDLLPDACASIGVYPNSTPKSSAASVPNGVWYGVGVAVIIFGVMAILLIYLFRRNFLVKHASPSSGVVATSSHQQSVAYNFTRETVGGTHKPEIIVGLSSAGPPSYAEVEAEKEKYAPPSYPGLQPSEMEAAAAEL